MPISIAKKIVQNRAQVLCPYVVGEHISGNILMVVDNGFAANTSRETITSNEDHNMLPKRSDMSGLRYTMSMQWKSPK